MSNNLPIPVVKSREDLEETLREGHGEFFVDAGLWDGIKGQHRVSMERMDPPYSDEYLDASFKIKRAFTFDGMEYAISEKVENHQFLVYFKVISFDMWERLGVISPFYTTELHFNSR